MESVDVYNNLGEKLNYTKERNSLQKGENRISCFAWIINSKKEILIQQRASRVKNMPNMWETVSGGAKTGDTPLSGTIREIKEELGIEAHKDNMELIGSYKRYNDFVVVYFLKQDINVSVEEYAEMIEAGLAVSSSFNILKEYLDNYYQKYMIFKDGKRLILSYKD